MIAAVAKNARLWERDDDKRKPIPSAPGYYVNAEGQILGRRGSVLAAHIPPDGYPQVTLHVGGRQCSRKVHILVCEAFHGPRPPGYQAAHGNGVRSDGRASNLRWASVKDNHADKRLHGTHRDLEAHPRALLTNDQVAAIRAEAAGMMGPKRLRYRSRQVLAERYGVGLHVIKDILAGRSWTQLGWLRKGAA